MKRMFWKKSRKKVTKIDTNRKKVRRTGKEVPPGRTVREAEAEVEAVAKTEVVKKEDVVEAEAEVLRDTGARKPEVRKQNRFLRKSQSKKFRIHKISLSASILELSYRVYSLNLLPSNQNLGHVLRKTMTMNCRSDPTSRRNS